jgi:hypothetical protein
MLTDIPCAYRIEWRSLQENRWIPTIACGRHVRLMAGRMPIRMSGGVEPVESCLLCQAVKKEKERLKLQGKPPESAKICVILPPSRQLKAG